MRIAELSFRVFGVFILFISALSCSTNLEVNAPYQETKIMYAILDAQQPFQVVRVSKGFLNEGRSALDIAKNNPDSSNFDPSMIEVKLTEFKNHSNSSAKRDSISWILHDTLYTSKEEGVFYSPDQIMYKTPNLVMESNLSRYPVYRVQVKNKLTGSIATGSTPACGRILDPTLYFKVPVVFDQPPKPILIGFKSTVPNPFRIDFPPNAEVMELRIVWRVKTVLSIGGPDSVHYDLWPWNQPGRMAFNGRPTTSLPDFATGSIPAGAFYDFIDAKTAELDNTNVAFREFQISDLELYLASGEYRKYAEVNGSYNAITQSKPIYSNVTNGLGLVASKNSSILPIAIDPQTLDSLRAFYPKLKLK